MPRRHTLLPLFAIFFLLLGACAPAPDAGDPRTVTVTGEGELVVVPEVATVRLAVQARDRELAAAQEQAGRVVTSVLELADELGIPRERVQSSELRVHPEFDWNEGRQTLRGYLVQRDIRVELEDLSKLGPLMERAMRAGVNDVSPPELKVKDERAAHREALRLAAVDARANADALAGSLDAKVGEARRINAVERDEPPVRPLEMAAMRAEGAGGFEQSYESGQITIRAKVRAEFELR